MPSTRAAGPLFAAFLAFLAIAVTSPAARADDAAYARLVALFEEWRAFERPSIRDGAPDYSDSAMRAKAKGLKSLQRRLAEINIKEWPIDRQIDHHIVRAEMNGMDFNIRILKPWSRDPAFYQQVWTYESDTPAHEGPVNHALIELWSYAFPLAPADAEKLAAELRTVRPFLAQARSNLDGDARDLWVAGIDTIEDQAQDLAALKARVSEPAVLAALDDAIAATDEFALWLKAEAPKKTGPSGIGKDAYNWHLKHVRLVPYTFDDEVMLLKRELHRAHASLKLEAHRNRGLPEIPAAATAEEYERRAVASVRKYMRFLEEGEVIDIEPYMEPALMEKIGSFSPEEERNFFAMATHREAMTLWTHFYHWWDLARIKTNPHPSPIRKGPLLYNIFDSRAEGMATAMEEMMLHAGLFDDNPRAREIVWIMQAQRAARGLASLRVHAREFTMKDARDFHVAWTPRGWMREDLDLLGFEQQLYLRQPGYGTSYVVGKHQIEQLLGERARQAGDDYGLKEFFREVDAEGVIPVSLIRWRLTGEADEITKMSE